MIESFNPGAIARYPGRQQRFEKMLQTGKDQDGKPLTDAVRADLKKSLAGLASVVAEMKGLVQVVPNVVFEHELRLDLGNREVQILFLGRGNTAGDTIVYLPREKLVVAGPGTDKDNGDWFDQSFGGLLKAASNQISIR
jgi:cyclase